jgi:hypothetical protein
MGAVNFSIDLRLVNCLKESFPLGVFVETGTFKGDTLASVHTLFRECHSAELSESLAAAARARFDGVANISIEQGDSAAFMEKLAPTLRDESVLYWLDAHWCASEGTAGITSQCPLTGEIKAIGRLNEKSVILIDDARLFLCTPPAPHEISQWPTLQQVLDSLRGLSSAHEVMVINDVIAFYPRSIADKIKGFASQHTVDWLAVTLASKPELVAELRAKLKTEREKIAKLREKVEKLKAEAKKKRRWWHFGRSR